MDPLMIVMLPVPATLINPVVELNLSVFTSRRNVSLVNGRTLNCLNTKKVVELFNIY